MEWDSVAKVGKGKFFVNGLVDVRSTGTMVKSSKMKGWIQTQTGRSYEHQRLHGWVEMDYASKAWSWSNQVCHTRRTTPWVESSDSQNAICLSYTLRYSSLKSQNSRCDHKHPWTVVSIPYALKASRVLEVLGQMLRVHDASLLLQGSILLPANARKERLTDPTVCDRTFSRFKSSPAL